jgi:hypothetical protein
MGGTPQAGDARRDARERIRLVFFRRHGEAHAEEVFRVAKIVAWINERLADRILKGHRRDRWRFCN